MSTPLNPDQPNPAQRDGVDVTKASDTSAPTGVQQPGDATATDPTRATSTGKAGFVPGQGVVPALDSAAPTNARLPQRLGDDGKNTPIGFGRLFSVELRKMIDTRAGKWLLIAMVLLILIASVGTMFGTRDGQPDFGTFVAAAGIPMGFLLPVLGILAVTSEWSQRTALVSFTLEPRRTRVVLAKWAAALLLGALSIVFAYAIGALTTMVAQAAFGHDAVWSLGWGAVAGNVFAQLIAVSIGIAFGLVFQNTPAAICSYLFIPILVTIITSFGEAMQKIGKWISLQDTTQPLYDGSMTPTGWKHFAVAHLLWLVLPMVVGFIRLNKREVKSS